MDSNLKFDIHIKTKCQKLDNATWFLREISGHFKGADRDTCKTMYKGILLPLLML